MTATVCRRCNEPLGLSRFLGADLCGSCAAKDKAERKAALEEYRSLSTAIGDPRTDPGTIGSNLPAIAERAGLKPQVIRDLNWKALLGAFETALSDEIITREEEDRLGRIAAALGFDHNDFARAIDHYAEEVFIARVNDGRLPELATPPILLKRNEVAHLVTNASLMKEVLVREYKGGSRGVSFRVMKGVSYRVGSHRGTMQVVGSRLEPADTGELVVTSQRVVFTGPRRTQECRYDKLIDVNVYRDAIELHVSNRQKPSLFQVKSGPMIAAAVNAAAQSVLA